MFKNHILPIQIIEVWKYEHFIKILTPNGFVKKYTHPNDFGENTLPNKFTLTPPPPNSP